MTERIQFVRKGIPWRNKDEDRNLAVTSGSDASKTSLNLISHKRKHSSTQVTSVVMSQLTSSPPEPDVLLERFGKGPIAPPISTDTLGADFDIYTPIAQDDVPPATLESIVMLFKAEGNYSHLFRTLSIDQR